MQRKTIWESVQAASVMSLGAVEMAASLAYKLTHTGELLASVGEVKAQGYKEIALVDNKLKLTKARKRLAKRKKSKKSKAQRKFSNDELLD